MRFGIFVGLFLSWVGVALSAPEATRPRAAPSVVDWQAAAATLTQYESLQLASGRGRPDAIHRLNLTSGRILPNIAASPVPVLLPIDIAAVLRDRPNALKEGHAVKNDAFFAGFHSPRFFLAGPGGYDAVFTILTSDIKELSDIAIPDPIDIHFSGLAFFYEIDEPAPEMRPAPALESKFPGIRRFVHEGFVRYAFMQHGVPYILAIECFDGRPRILRLLCTQADRVAVHFLNQLQIAGGTPQAVSKVEPPAVERPKTTEATFTYHAPGKIYPGSGFRSANGRTDYTVWARIRFPLAAPPAYANSQIYRDKPRSKAVREASASTDYSYPWRDNFCERRGFTVGQCPAGIGHQGQDLRPAPCSAPLGNDRCSPAHDLVAVRDGAVMRSPKQEALYIVINGPNEHLRFRYLHMEPRKMDEDNLLSGRDVREGEIIGQVSNYSQKENGTSYHLHFDVQMPTKLGWVFVSPYMTLVVAYERLIGGRGVEIVEEPQTRQAMENESNSGLRGLVAIPGDKRIKPVRAGKNDEIIEPEKDQLGATESIKSTAE